MKVTSTFSFLVLLGMSSLLLAGPEPIPVSSKEVRQELPPNPFTWEGSYIGLHGGGTFGETEANDTREYTNFTFVDDEHAESWSYDTAGFMGGIQWGYLWQRGHFVFGPETDLGYLNVDGGGTLHGDQVDAHSSTESNFYWTSRGRLGWAFGRLLLYGTGGAIGVNYEASIRGLPGDHDSKSEFRVGWTGGGGIEYALNNRWSIKAEYLYFELENGTINLHSTRNISGDTDVFQFDHQSFGHIVRLGVNYHFGPCPPAEQELSTSYSKDAKNVVQPTITERHFTWDGLYVGVQGGGSSGDLKWTDEPTENDELLGRYGLDGWFGGGHIGFNKQLWWFVIGTEWNFSGADIDGSRQASNITDYDRIDTKIDWIASGVTRVGIALPMLFDGRVLFYGAAGMSDAHTKWRGHDIIPANDNFDTEENRFAPIYGGGVEVAITPHWTVRVQYDHADYGTKIIRGGRHGLSDNESEQYQTNFELDTVEGAISFKF